MTIMTGMMIGFKNQITEWDGFRWRELACGELAADQTRVLWGEVLVFFVAGGIMWFSQLGFMMRCNQMV